jgi:putative aminopeptidase FrvX
MSKKVWNETIDYSMMKEVALADGIAGNEKEVSRVLKRYVSKCVDEVFYDHLGSIAFKKKGSGSKTIMIAGHTDEVGFLVKHIDDQGFIKLHPVGGWWGHVLPSKPLTITTQAGDKIIGIVGSQPPHGMKPEVRKQVIEVNDLFLDCGFSSLQEALDAGIQYGDMVTPHSEFFSLGDGSMLATKAWDDRIGALIMAQVMINLKDVTPKSHVVGVGTVQEEVGLRGAKTAAAMVNPDVAITLDVTIATDIPKGDKRIKMGHGVTLEIADASHFAHRGLLAHVAKIAKDLDIEVQFEMLAAGGTDSGEIHKSGKGVIAITMSIPSRYIHSHYALVHHKDVKATIDVLTHFVTHFDDEEYEALVLNQ